MCLSGPSFAPVCAFVVPVADYIPCALVRLFWGEGLPLSHFCFGCNKVVSVTICLRILWTLPTRDALCPFGKGDAPSGPPLGPVGSRAHGAHAHRNTERQVVDGLRTEVCGRQKQSNNQHNNQHSPQYANHWAPQTRKRHQQEYRPQRPTERSDPTQHAKGRTGDCPGPRKGATTVTNVTQGGVLALAAPGWGPEATRPPAVLALGPGHASSLYP